MNGSLDFSGRARDVRKLDSRGSSTWWRPHCVHGRIQLREHSFHFGAALCINTAWMLLLDGSRHREPMPSICTKAHAIVRHSTQIRIARLLGIAERIKVELECAPDRECIRVLADLVIVLTPLKIVVVRRTADEASEAQAE